MVLKTKKMKVLKLAEMSKIKELGLVVKTNKVRKPRKVIKREELKLSLD